eukprot:765700-Hanusia_phi.AAC.2
MASPTHHVLSDDFLHWNFVDDFFLNNSLDNPFNGNLKLSQQIFSIIRYIPPRSLSIQSFQQGPAHKKFRMNIAWHKNQKSIRTSTSFTTIFSIGTAERRASMLDQAGSY